MAPKATPKKKAVTSATADLSTIEGKILSINKARAKNAALTKIYLATKIKEADEAKLRAQASAKASAKAKQKRPTTKKK